MEGFCVTSLGRLYLEGLIFGILRFVKQIPQAFPLSPRALSFGFFFPRPFLFRATIYYVNAWNKLELY